MAGKKKATTKLAPAVGWPLLRAVGEEYDAVQRSRIRAANREAAFLRSTTGDTGQAPVSISEALDVAIVARLADLEEDVGRALRRTYKKVAPDVIVEWQRAQLGLGDLQLARFLGHLGHPRIARPMRWVGEGADRHLVEDAPFERTVSQLVAYTGRTGDPARRKRTGMSAEDAFGLGKPMLRMLSFLIAQQMVKSGVRKTDATDDSDLYDIDGREALSPWAQIYLDQRKLGRDRLDWTLGHQHSAALHRVAKEFVKSLWEVAGEDPALPELRQQIVTGPGQGPTDTQSVSAGAGHTTTAAAASTLPSTPIPGATPSPQPRRKLVRRKQT